MPSPIRLIRRWTRKNPTAGASIPTTAPVANASRMKSVSKMDMGRVVPGGRKLGGVAVEDDAAADEHQPLDEALDGSELVRDEKDRHGEIAMKSFEQRRERFLRVGVDTGSRFVEHEQIGLGREGLRDEGALLLATGEPCDDGVRVSGKADAGDRLVDRRAVAGSKSAENAEARNSTDGGNLSNGDRRVDHQLARRSRRTLPARPGARHPATPGVSRDRRTRPPRTRPLSASERLPESVQVRTHQREVVRAAPSLGR